MPSRPEEIRWRRAITTRTLEAFDFGEHHKGFDGEQIQAPGFVDRTSGCRFGSS
jgi:hypothetical protein